MNAAYGHVDRMLDHAVVALDADEVTSDIVIDRGIIKAGIAFAVDLANLVKLFLEGLPYERSHVEVEGRDRLTSVHLVLHCLHRDTSEDAGSLDALCGT